MAALNRRKLNRLERTLPEGLLVDAAWLTAHGYSTSLRSQYVSAGWLEQPARRLYRRPRGSLSWQQVVISLQTLLAQRLVVGGRTALELQGYAHYVPASILEVHLHGPSKPPSWLGSLPLKERFVYHNSVPLFGNDLKKPPLPTLLPDKEPQPARGHRLQEAGPTVLPWGQWEWPLMASCKERALLELLNELPDHESFHQVDMLMEGLSDLSPRKLQMLLATCRSVKVKRLFFFFADRHGHAWLKRLDQDAVDLGKGKRMLAPGGRLDPRYQITVPKDLETRR